MPTVEERLAALEARMAAWIDQQPTTYYEHQYSGEEIDAAVGRALAGGALDTSVTNVSNQLGTFVRPNLLDNWYFGRPVNQRNGYIIPRDTQIYADSTLTDTSPGVTTAWRQVEYVNSTYCIYRGTEGSGLYYVKTSDAIPGYCSVRYTVDRWKLTYGNGQAFIKDGYVSLLGSGMNFSQILDENVYKPLRGKTVTLSIIGRGDCQIVSEDAPSSYNAAFLKSDVFTLASFSFLTKSDSDRFIFHVKPNTSNPVDILAAKLELGPTQSLAHREGDKWVLNEVPKYSRELLDCQRYHYQVHYNQYETIGFAYDGPEYAFIIIPLPTEMRGATPTLKIIGDISIGGKVRTLTGCSCHGCEAIIGVNYTAQPSSAGATYAYSTSAGGVTISIIYDL